MKVNRPTDLDHDSEELGQRDTSWKVRKSAVKILKNLLHVKEESAVSVDITKSCFGKILPLLKHVDSYVNEDLYEYLLEVGLLHLAP